MKHSFLILESECFNYSGLYYWIEHWLLTRFYVIFWKFASSSLCLQWTISCSFYSDTYNWYFVSVELKETLSSEILKKLTEVTSEETNSNKAPLVIMVVHDGQLLNLFQLHDSDSSQESLKLVIWLLSLCTLFTFFYERELWVFCSF